jgi:hypothetical protein
MERSQRKERFYPTSCPRCGHVVHLRVGNSGEYTNHIHRCKGILYYRCWTEGNLPYPRVEFLDPNNAQHFLLRPHADDDQPVTIESPPFQPTDHSAVPTSNVRADPREVDALAARVMSKRTRGRG